MSSKLLSYNPAGQLHLLLQGNSHATPAVYSEYNTVLKQGSKLNTFFIRLTSVYIDIRLEQFCLMRRFISISWGVSYNIALWVLHLSVRTWAIYSVSLAAGYDPSRSSTLCLSRHFMLVGIIICANQSEFKFQFFALKSSKKMSHREINRLTLTMENMRNVQFLRQLSFFRLLR